MKRNIGKTIFLTIISHQENHDLPGKKQRFKRDQTHNVFLMSLSATGINACSFFAFNRFLVRLNERSFFVRDSKNSKFSINILGNKS